MPPLLLAVRHAGVQSVNDLWAQVALCDAGPAAPWINNFSRIGVETDHSSASLASTTISKHATRNGGTRHFKLDSLSFWLRVATREKDLILKLVSSGENLADIFTKAVARDQFIRAREVL